jgi:hypothetical protein
VERSAVFFIRNLKVSPVLPSVIPIEAEGIAAPILEIFSDKFTLGMRHGVPKQKCHPDRSEAKWRDLLFIICGIES